MTVKELKEALNDIDENLIIGIITDDGRIDSNVYFEFKKEDVWTSDGSYKRPLAVMYEH